eukprot:4582928-Pyramimonas_sp.AAC.1
MHPSHTLEVSRGILYCSRCGAVCVEQARKLLKSCERPTRMGKDVLQRIARGLPPKSGMAFPEL